MILDRVTITGADDGVNIDELVRLTLIYPHVEWGVLLSKAREGTPRFPSLQWLEQAGNRHSLALSGHLCGSWVRDVLDGGSAFMTERPTIAKMFNRLQLNVGNDRHTVQAHRFVNGLWSLDAHAFILQMTGGANDELFDVARSADINLAPLFDSSGGSGLLPQAWPKHVSLYSGYAGGLTPENVERELGLIAAVCPPRAKVWIDVESGVRDEENRFDINRVTDFLYAVRDWVGQVRMPPREEQQPASEETPAAHEQ